MTNITGNYSIFTNADDEIMITILEHDGEPKEPKIIYDGKDHAIFYRNLDNSVLLDYINPAVREHLKKAKTILMVEVPTPEAKEPTRSYDVPMKIIPRIPAISFDLPPLEELLDSPEALEKVAQTLIDEGVVKVEENPKKG